MKYTFEITDVYSDLSARVIEVRRSDGAEFGLGLRRALSGMWEACISGWDEHECTGEKTQYFHNIELAAMWLVAQTGMKPDWIVE